MFGVATAVELFRDWPGIRGRELDRRRPAQDGSWDQLTGNRSRPR